MRFLLDSLAWLTLLHRGHVGRRDVLNEPDPSWRRLLVFRFVLPFQASEPITI